MGSNKIIAINAPLASLSKAQKEFNRLTRKIAQLRKEIEATEAGTDKVRQKITKDLFPLKSEYDQQRSRMVRLLDRYMQSSGFKAGEKKKIKHLICITARELFANGVEGMKEIFEKYSDASVEEVEEEENEAVMEQMKAMFEAMYGIEFDEDADVSTPEKMKAYIDQKLDEQEAAYHEEQRKRQEKKQQRPKTAKQQEAEEKRAAKAQKEAEEAQKISKSVRDVYLDLVKTFHPDMEPDETEKLRKTEIMQRVTAAYENNDLLALLSLQLEFERINTTDLDSLPEDRLKLFNKTLLQQLNELQMQLSDRFGELSMMFSGNSPFGISSIDEVEWMIKRDVKTLKSAIKELKQEIHQFEDPAFLRAWLKDYRISDFTDFDYF